MTIINECYVSQNVWHAKEPSLLNGHELRAQVKIFAFQRQWWRLHMSENISSGTKNSKPTNKFYFINSFIDLLFSVSRLSTSGNGVSEISIQKQNSLSILHFIYLITI